MKLLRNFSEFKRKLVFPILKQPEAIKKMKTQNIIFFLITSFILDVMSFCLQGVNMALEANLIGLAIFLLILHFGERIIESLFTTYKDLKDDLFRQLYSSESAQIVMNLCHGCRNKVLKNENGFQTVMDSAELIQKSKWYIDAVWNFWWNIPTTVSNIFTLLFMIVTTIIIEFQDDNLLESIFVMLLLFICVIIYIFLGWKRIKLLSNYRKTRKNLEAEEDVLYTEIKSIEYMSKQDFEYHASRFKKHLLDSREVVRIENLKLNKIFEKRAFISSGFMIFILLFKIYTADNIDASVILNVVAISTVYSNILLKISSVINKVETIADIIIDVETIYPDFQNIYNVYLDETNKALLDTSVNNITITPFSVSYDPKKVYELNNMSSFILRKGDFVLVQGPTGCGKSTLLALLVGKLQLENKSIVFSSGHYGYLQSIAYQTDKSMANNFILNEIILNDDFSTADREKLFEILHGLCLYDEIARMAYIHESTKFLKDDDEKVFEFLKIRKYEQFSSGQKQRFAIAKLLYSLSKEHQIVALDEVFNRLDDQTVKKCLPFISEFVNRDIKRIVLLATHQVELARKFCNKEILFSQDLAISTLKVIELSL